MLEPVEAFDEGAPVAAKFRSMKLAAAAKCVRENYVETLT